MSQAAGWISLIREIGQRFEQLSRGSVTLHFYASPKADGLPPPGGSENMRKAWEENVVQQGGLPSYALFPSSGCYHLHANPQAQNEAFFRVQRQYRDEFLRCAEDAWAVLPRDVRRMAVGAGWLVLVYRLLREAGTGSVFWSPDFAGMEIDVSKASVFAIRELTRREADGTLSNRPQSLSALLEWLSERTGWFRSYFENPEEYQPNPRQVEELYCLTGEPIPAGSENVTEWAKLLQVQFLRWVLYVAHDSLDQWGISGQPNWASEPVDNSWFLRANDHLSHLLNFLRGLLRQNQNNGESAGKALKPEIIDVTDSHTAEKWVTDLTQAERWTWRSVTGSVTSPRDGEELVQLRNGIFIRVFSPFGRSVASQVLNPGQRRQAVTLSDREALKWFQDCGYDPPADLLSLPEAGCVNSLSETKITIGRTPPGGNRDRSDDKRVTFLPGAFLYRGHRQPLSGKPLEVLKALYEAQGKTLTLAALRDKVWTDSITGEETIRSAVKAVRKAVRQAIEAVGAEGPADPVPAVDRGTNRTAWRLELP